MNTRHQTSSMRIWRKALHRSTSLLLALLLSQSILVAGAQQSSGPRRESQADLEWREGPEATHGLVPTERDEAFFADNDVRTVEFSPDGLRYQPKVDQAAGADLRYRLREVRSGDSAQVTEANQSARPRRHRNEVYYARSDGLLEKYRAVEDGVEQVFILQQPLGAADEDLVISGEVATALQPEGASLRTLSGVNFLAGRAPIIHYGSPVITDAVGRETTGELRLERDQLDLVVDGLWLKDTAFPVTVATSIRSYASAQESASGEFVSATALSMEEWPIWRIQLRVQIADVGYAGTDDYVSARLNDYNLTWMDYGRNDFERNSVFSYDLVQDGSLAKLGDITMLRFSKTGSDGLCLRALTLYVNGVAICNLDYGPSGRWLDNDGTDRRTITLSSAALRAHPYWVNFPITVPARYLSRAELESRIEGIVGNEIKGQSVYWGHLYGRAVEVTKKDDRTIHVDLDLAYDLTALPDPEIDFDFDVSFSCSNGRVVLTIKNVKVNVETAWYVEVLGAIIWTELAEWYIGHRIETSIGTITRTLGTPYCPNMHVYSDGTVMMEF